ncbi:MAG: hypothetical protein ACJAUF_000384 [Bacteroidia bacterium]
MGNQLIGDEPLHLRNAIQEGIESGQSSQSLDQIFEEKKNEMIADGRLIL